MGLSLIHAGFLAAGLAVGLPILIHLLLRQKTRTVPIGSVRFLQQVVREHRRRRRLRQWILLALRMLAVLLLALLFARPYWDESYRRGMETEIVLLIDRSASMGAQDSGRQTALARGIAKTREELKRVDENAIVHVALCDAAGVKEIPVEELDGVKTSVAATDYGLALSWANDVLAASKRANRTIVLLTDLQASGLPRAQSAAAARGNSVPHRGRRRGLAAKRRASPPSSRSIPKSIPRHSRRCGSRSATTARSPPGKSP